ncbi:MAG: ATP synthase F1 subunit epsilon [Oscillospiraceae bacterium]|nr:ATP synthase F1 subunit epsilon [Oscillospiraceae bacterium]
MRTFKFKVITPDKILFDGEAEQVIVRTTEGDVGILAGHENYVANLPPGVLKINLAGGEVKYAAIAGGFLKVSYENITRIITTAAEWGEDIDTIWANRSREDALNKIKQAKTDSEMSRAELKLKRALNRIQVSSLQKH